MPELRPALGVGKKLRAARVGAGMTQRQLAEKLSSVRNVRIGQSTISQAETSGEAVHPSFVKDVLEICGKWRGPGASAVKAIEAKAKPGAKKKAKAEKVKAKKAAKKIPAERKSAKQLVKRKPKAAKAAKPAKKAKKAPEAKKPAKKAAPKAKKVGSAKKVKAPKPAAVAETPPPAPEATAASAE